MIDFRDKPDAITRWRATVEALEALVQAAPEAEEIPGLRPAATSAYAPNDYGRHSSTLGNV
jgi:hypothetical protein